MVGLGETHDEMVETFAILREHGVQVLTVGQYLRPTERHLPVVRYWHPDEFKALEGAAYELGFDHIAAGPLVRSSYHADQHVPQDEPGTRPARGGAQSDLTSDTVGIKIPTVLVNDGKDGGAGKVKLYGFQGSNSVYTGRLMLEHKGWTTSPSCSCPRRTPSSCSASASRRWACRR